MVMNQEGDAYDFAGVSVLLSMDVYECFLSITCWLSDSILHRIVPETFVQPKLNVA